MAKFLFLIVLAFGCTDRAVAQAAQSSCIPPGTQGGQSLAISRIGVGTPYTLTAVIKADMVTSKGVKTTGGVTTSFQARDSQGRTRIDAPGGCFMGRDGQPHWMGRVSINDPYANTFTSWRVNVFLSVKSATVKNGSINAVDPPTAQEEFDGARLLSQASDHDPQAKTYIQYKVEALGKRTILGLEASGMRITKTFPAGILNSTSAAALPVNQRPFTEVEERWTSNQYRLILLDLINNEATGMSSYEVTSFTPGDPDPSVFQAPADYSIVAQ